MDLRRFVTLVAYCVWHNDGMRHQHELRMFGMFRNMICLDIGKSVRKMATSDQRFSRRIGHMDILVHFSGKGRAWVRSRPCQRGREASAGNPRCAAPRRKTRRGVGWASWSPPSSHKATYTVVVQVISTKHENQHDDD